MTMSSNAFPVQIIGRWNKNKYEVVRELGRGANGIVYQVTRDNQYYACKCSSDLTTIQMEINVLQHFARTRERFYGSFLLDADDFLWNGQLYSYYIMPYFKGVTLDRWIRQKGRGEAARCINHLLERVGPIHEAGYAFGDIKAANVLVSPGSGEVTLIDFGGVTPFGQGIRQYTEQYDQGVWKGASRKADQIYDLFSISILFLELLVQDRILLAQLLKSRAGMAGLERLINKYVEPHYRKVLWYGIRGKYQSVENMRKHLIQCDKSLKNQRQDIVPSGRGLIYGMLFIASILYLCGYWLQGNIP